MDIFEHGVTVESGDTLMTLKRIATTNLPVYSHFSVTIVDHDGSSLNEKAVQVGRVNTAHWIADYHEETDLRYCLLATLYHLEPVF